MEGKDATHWSLGGILPLSYVYRTNLGPTLPLGIPVSLTVAGVAGYLLFRNTACRAGPGEGA